MENKLDVIQTEEYQEAISTHQKIMANMEVAATAMVDLCKNLKIMRDKKLYTNLGMDSFEEYSEQMAGIKQRQAYNYISIYERYGETVLQSNANLGITKLEILTAIPDTKRDDFLEENDVESMSTRELKDTIKKLEETKEQLSLLTNERDNLKTNLDAINDKYQDKEDKLTLKIAELEQELKEAQETPTDVAVEELSPEELKKIKSEAEQEIKEKYEKKIKAERDKASSAKNELKVLKESQSEQTKKAVAEATEQVKKNLEQTEQEKAQLLERTKEMEQSLMTAANPELIKAEFYFDQLREAGHKLNEIIQQMNDTDPDTANKLAGAIVKYYEQTLSELPEV